MNQNNKPKLAMYWASSCGGCEISTLNIGENILAVDELFEIAFFPCIADFKVKDVQGYPDGYIDVCLFNGAIRNSENQEMAELLRRKSKVLAAFGACAHQGSIPALSNLTSRTATMESVYLDNPTLDNPEGIVPNTPFEADEGMLELPRFFNTVRSLSQVVPVDYTIPGCPPEPHQIWTVLQAVAAALLQGAELPPTGSIIGAGTVAVCKECTREKEEKQISHFYRPFEVVPEAERCLLAQGIICMGAATRSGCGALCPQVGIGCRGCYGPPDGVDDQGAAMVSALASIMDITRPSTNGSSMEKQIDTSVDTIADPAGTFYRFSLANAVLGRARQSASPVHK